MKTPHDPLAVGVATNGASQVSIAPVDRWAEDKASIHEVVAGYYDTFARNSTAAAAFYGEPALVVLPDEVLSLPTRKHVEDFLAKALSSLKAFGYSSTRMSDSRVKMLNPTTALHGTVAVRMTSDGTEFERAAFTYLLHKGGAGWKIHQLVVTDVDHLISPD